MSEFTILDLYGNRVGQTLHLPEIVDDVVPPPYDVTPYLAAAHYGEQLSLLSLLRQRPATRMRSVSDVVAVDLFAGGGGASLGLELATGRSPIVAVNHDWHAIQMHMANHPLSIHFHRDVWDVPPSAAVNGAKIDLLWASPDCTHFSRARGGKPVEKEIRGLIWIIIEWAHEVRPTVIAGENVAEILTYGPLYPANHPDPKLRNKPIKGRAGEIWDAFKLALGPGCPETHPSWEEIPERVRPFARRGCGYTFEHAKLCAADYGAPTSRERLYFVARRDGEPIRWPEPTHGPGRAQPHRTAAECLDFDEPSLSIFADPSEAKAWAKAHGSGLPKRPLAEPTMRRIAEGIRRFVLTSADPYIVVTGHQSSDGGKVKPIHGPLSTIVTKAEHCLVTPVVTKFYGTSKAGATVEEPMPTVTAQAGGGHLGMAEAVLAPAEMSTPLVMRAHGKGWDKPGKASGVTKPDQPFPTITATEEWSVVTPILVQSGYGERKGQAPRALDITKSLGTVVGAGGKHALVSAFMAKHYGGVVGHGLDRPLGTVTSIDHHSLVEADLSTTPVQPDRREMVAAFLVLYYGSGGQWQKLDEPMKTVVAKARLGLVEVVLDGVPYVIMDIRMRMLTPRELARAQGFPDTYILTGTKAQQIERIGNSVCPPVARAIAEANFGPARDPNHAPTATG